MMPLMLGMNNMVLQIDQPQIMSLMGHVIWCDYGGCGQVSQRTDVIHSTRDNSRWCVVSDLSETSTDIITHPFFAGLTTTELSNALQLIPRSTHRRGEFLFHVGETAEVIFLLFSGLVKKSYYSPGGDEKIISIVQAGEVFGELFLGKYTQRVGTAQAVTDAHVGRLTKTNLQELISQFPQLSLNLIAHLADEQRETLARLHALMHIDARHRLLGTLLSLVRRAECVSSDWYPLPTGITQDDIASITCLNRSTASLYINEFRKAGVLGGTGRQVTVNRSAVETLLRRAGLDILE
ncbi:MAG: Crp/Fnr family transcriptional regulator [Anaerolineae bacterium]